MKNDSWPEANISEILKSHGIEPCKKTYDVINGGNSLILSRNGVCVPYKTSRLGEANIGNSAIDFKALVVKEDEKEMGMGISYEVTRGGTGRGLLVCGSNYWENPENGVGIIGSLIKLNKKSAEGGI